MSKFWLGLTGSIGMGKTTTAEMFRAEGIPVWDADATVHRLYAKGGAAVASIQEAFPEAVIDDTVSRDELKKIIAADLAALGVIESIVHPLVTADRESFKDGTDGLMVFDIPLLFEIKADEWLDAVLVVSVPAELQRSRVFSREGMTQEQFQNISERQLPDLEKRQRADFVIETFDMEETRAKVVMLIKDLKDKVSNA